jgi:hypothetical protein
MILTSCDPGLEILFIYDTLKKNTLEISIDTINYPNYKIPILSDTLKREHKFTLVPHDTLYMLYGIGTWSNEDIKAGTKPLNKFLFDNKVKEVTLKNPEAIAKVFAGQTRSWSW